MKTCIICRKTKDESLFNDEHVIPESIGGYYHIWKVCQDCNNKLGRFIDPKLTNHKFIEFQRHLLNIRGKSGKVPNPFAGTHTINGKPEQKIQCNLKEDGSFEFTLIPLISKEKTDIGESINIVIDKKDEAKAEDIINKFLTRNGIPREQVTFETTNHSFQPWIKTSMALDVHSFKLAILKIAYEFTVDKVPEYFDDEIAKKISNILFTADFDGLDTIQMIGNGLNNEILKPFEYLIELENDNHYLILTNTPEIGLVCFVNLFNTFNIGFIMSEKSDYVTEMLFLKNDIKNRTAITYTMSDLLKSLYTPIEFRFQYLIPDLASVQEFHQNEAHPNFGFYTENEHIPLFNYAGEVMYSDMDIKFGQSHLRKIDRGDFKTEIRTEIQIDEPLFVKTLPNNRLYQIKAVQLVQYRIGKL